MRLKRIAKTLGNLVLMTGVAIGSAATVHYLHTRDVEETAQNKESLDKTTNSPIDIPKEPGWMKKGWYKVYKDELGNLAYKGSDGLETLVCLALDKRPEIGETGVETSENLDDYLNEKKFEEFVKAEGSIKQALWETSDDEDSKKTAIIDTVDYFIKKRIEGNRLLRGMIKLHASGIEWTFDSFYEKKLTEIGINVDELYKNRGNLVGYLAEKYGIDLNQEEVGVRRFKGADNSVLKWADSIEGRNSFIGDGKVWLDLEKIPFGVEIIEYSDGRFTLHMYENKEGEGNEGKKYVLTESNQQTIEELTEKNSLYFIKTIEEYRGHVLDETIKERIKNKYKGNNDESIDLFFRLMFDIERFYKNFDYSF